MECRTVVSRFRRRTGLGVVVVLILFQLLTPSVDAANVSLAWDASDSSDVSSYTLHYGTNSGSYLSSLDVGDTLTGTISNLVEGTLYYFVVTARNIAGLDSLPSNEVTYTVPGGTNNPTNTPPVVSAGGDVTIQLPASASLAGSVVDDGLPNPPGTWSATWTKVSGPGTVQFSASDSPTSSASFSVTGQYVLRLTASDSVLTASDDVTVAVQSGADITAPGIVGLHVDTADARTVSLGWNTDEPARCQVEFGPSTALGTTTPLEPNLSTTHTGVMTGLAPSSTNYFRIRATDASGNIGFSSVQTAGTMPVTVFGWAAEDGNITAPMRVASRETAMDGRYVVSDTNDAGAALFPIQVPLGSEYRLWCRVWAPAAGVGSFYVSANGTGEDIFDAAETGWKDGWQWVVVNGRGNGAPLTINPRRFILNAGPNQFNFRAQEGGVLLDHLLLSNDPDWLPGINGDAPVLTATFVTSNQVNLSWADSLTNEMGFRIEWSTDASIFSDLVTMPVNATNYQHVGVTASSPSYRVYGFNDSDRTDYSNVATPGPGQAPAAPANLRVSVIRRTEVRISWNDVSSNETGFVVERSTEGSGFSTVVTTTANITSADDVPSAPGDYTYRVRSFNEWGTSAPSATDIGRVK